MIWYTVSNNIFYYLQCIHWMAPFAMTVRDIGLQPVKEFNSVDAADAHNIQTHVNDISALVRLHFYNS